MSRLSKRGDESGFTLVELIVYSVLMIVVIGFAGALFIRMLHEQRQTIAMADANNEAQMVFKQIEFDLRNADFAEVRGNGDLLVVRTRIAGASGASSPYCVGYYFDEAKKELRRVQTTANAPTSDALAATSDSGRDAKTSTWRVLATDVGSIGGARVFGGADGAYDTNQTVSIDARFNSIDNRKPIDFSKSVSLRPQSGLGAGCR